MPCGTARSAGLRPPGRRGVPCGLVAALGVPFAVTDPGRFLRVLSLLFTSTTIGPGPSRSAARLADAPPVLAALRRRGWRCCSPRAGVGVVRALIRDPCAGALMLAFPVCVLRGGRRRSQSVLPLCAAARAVPVPHRRLRRRRRLDLAGTCRTTRACDPGCAAAAGLTALLVAEPAWRTWQFDRLMATTDNRVVAAEWIAAHVPAGSALLTTGSHYGFPWLPTDRGYRFWVWDRREQRYWSPDDDRRGPSGCCARSTR